MRARSTSAGVDAIEITHGDGLAGVSFNYGFGAHTDLDWIEAVAAVVKRAKVTVLLIPGIGTVEDLRGGARRGRAIGADRDAQHRGRHREAAHRACAQDRGMDVAGFLMMAHMTPPRRTGAAGEADGVATARTACT